MIELSEADYRAILNEDYRIGFDRKYDGHYSYNGNFLILKDGKIHSQVGPALKASEEFHWFLMGEDLPVDEWFSRLDHKYKLKALANEDNFK